MQVIANGGMGRVYKALDQVTGEAVAVKQLLLEGAEAQQRFEREAEMLKLIEHPNIVRYVAHGAEGTNHYLVMRFIGGEALSAKLVRVGSTVDEAIVLGRELAGALAVLHRRGLVHRDVKPSNVMVPQAAMSPATLVDFGLVRAIDTRISLTRTGVTLGSPGYMSPEQLVGARVLTPAVDVYGLGCVLYVALTGVAPFPGNVPPAVYARMLALPPPAPLQLNPECPPRLSELVLRMLAIDPAGRPLDGLAVEEHLAAVSLTGGSQRRTRVVPRSSSPPAPNRSNDVPTAEVPTTDTHFAIALGADESDVDQPTGNEPGSGSLLAASAQAHEASQLLLADGSALVLSKQSSHRATRLKSGATCALELAQQKPDHAVALSVAAEDSDALLDRVFEMLADEHMRRAVSPHVDPVVRIDARTFELLQGQFATRKEEGRCYLVGPSG
ncbi:MAG: serine/threonine protein kinase [Archangiaceae bacterium]|nr:serine/threonine protein kinase [Archangiaceae bacterium]